MGGPPVVAMGLIGSEDPVDSEIQRGRRLLRVPQFGPQNPAYGGAKISGDPVQSVCSQGALVVPLLASILGS